MTRSLNDSKNCMGKLLLSSTLVWVLTIQPTLAFPLNHNGLPSATNNYLISQNSVPPSLTQSVRKHLSQQTKIPINQLKIQSTKSMTWPDGCLGLAKPDELCTQALVQGWQIVVAHEKHTWTYRTDAQGKNIRLATPH